MQYLGDNDDKFTISEELIEDEFDEQFIPNHILTTGEFVVRHQTTEPSMPINSSRNQDTFRIDSGDMSYFHEDPNA